MNKIVAKFGGTSVANVEAIKRSAQIVAENPKIGVVVVSATATTTNHLEEFASKSLNSGQEALNLWEDVYSRHYNMAQDLNADQSVLDALEDIFCEGESLALRVKQEGGLSAKMMDSFYALGERMSTPLFKTALKQAVNNSCDIVELDAREIIWTDDNFLEASPLKESIYESCQRLIEFDREHRVFVTQGFIGSTLEGRVTTLGREGSDFSAALFCEGLRASELQIWTDVEGVLSSDPRIVSNPKTISELDYLEAEALSLAGAKVIHPKTYSSLKDLGMPLYVASSLKGSTSPGTWIMNLNLKEARVVGIASDRDSISLVGHNIHILKDDLLNSFRELSFKIRSISHANHSIRLILGLEEDKNLVINELHKLLFE